VGGLRYTVRDRETGLLVPREDPAALAESIALLLEDEPLRLRMGANGQRHAQRYSWATIAHEMRELYDHVLCGEPVLDME
jgi:D-inositol-3-phosphate glycosyltransferase